MNADENVQKWWFTKRIEDMPIGELRDRMKQVLSLDLAKKIVVLPYSGRDEVVSYSTDELISLCPATGYPDLNRVTIRYRPDQLVPELKSLKFYLGQFMQIPISHEHLASKIYWDFIQTIMPQKCHLSLVVAIRGGITTTVEIGDDL